MSWRPWPRSLFGRLVLVLTLGLAFAQVVSVGVFLKDRGEALFLSTGRQLTGPTARLVQGLEQAPQESRRGLLRQPEFRHLRGRLVHHPRSDLPPGAQDNPISRRIAELLRKELPEHTQIRVTTRNPRFFDYHHGDEIDNGEREPEREEEAPPPPPRGALIEIRLSDGQWLRLRPRLPPEIGDLPRSLMISLSVLLVSVILIALLAVRWTTRPLRTLAHAADELGQDIQRDPLPENGPSELRAAAAAFNRMQTRIQRFVADRAQLLAAVSHDLKTPITRMRLRAELLDDEQMREALLKDLAEMEAMVQDSLSFARELHRDEPRQPLDITALVDSLLDDQQALGHTASLEGEAQRPYPGRPLALKRCLGNIIDNAIKYGGEVQVSIRDGAENLHIDVLDKGPGIPESELERVFEPFYRLEKSRSRETGGSGMGLAIAREIARVHGGDLSLANRPDGGLQATLRLPR